MNRYKWVILIARRPSPTEITITREIKIVYVLYKVIVRPSVLNV